MNNAKKNLRFSDLLIPDFILCLLCLFAALINKAVEPQFEHQEGPELM
jgi:hypothetical protein